MKDSVVLHKTITQGCSINLKVHLLAETLQARVKGVRFFTARKKKKNLTSENILANKVIILEMKTFPNKSQEPISTRSISPTKF